MYMHQLTLVRLQPDLDSPTLRQRWYRQALTHGIRAILNKKAHGTCDGQATDIIPLNEDH